MRRSTVLRVLCAALFVIMIAWAPESVLAQRGGHGGGFHGGSGFHSGSGGFHGGGYRGGGGGAFYGGGYHGGGAGAFHGGGYHGGYYGWHGGHGGWGGGNWGYPGYGYGWGFGISFGWGPFWGGFGYPNSYYGWAPSYYPYYYPYPYPYYVPAAPSGYVASASPNDNGYAYSSGPSTDYVPEDYSAQQSSAPAPPATPAANSMTIRNASYTSTTRRYTTYASAGTSSSYAVARNATHQLPPLRPEVQNVIRALRAMPPAARERQIDSGRYGNLTPKELEIVRYAADLPPA